MWLSYRNASHAVVENFDKVEHIYGDECEESDKCETDCKQDCYAMPGYTYPAQEVKRIALFHYVTRCAPPAPTSTARPAHPL